MKQSLQIKQGQSLVMTQQLQQSIKLLQYSAAELSAFVAEEMEKNPLLSPDEGGATTMEVSQQPESGEGEVSSMLDAAEAGALQDAGAQATDSLDTNDDAMWGGVTEPPSQQAESQHHDYSTGGGGATASHGDSPFLADSIERHLQEAPDLKKHLMEQVQLDIVDMTERVMAGYMVDLLDENGYLRESTAQIAQQLGAEQTEVEALLVQLQRCDPVGVFARDLKECLKLQLVEQDRFDPVMECMIEHLELIGRGDLKKLVKICGVDEEDILDMLTEIRALDPHPGSHFEHSEVETLVPDVFVKKTDEGWRVELNPDALPRVLVNRDYHTQLSDGARSKDEKKFLNEQLSNASWLVKALDQRANTMLKVSTEILRQQERFFERGVRFLKPMTLKEVAEKVDLHESSISRVTNNKYIATGRGVFELKYFFSSSLSGASGDGQFSSKSVMSMIEEIISAEKADAILSDDAIAEKLKQRGVDCARRTVVKYRTKMGIPSSVQRRKAKRAL